jgi:type I restriction enzyme R subunit
LGFTSKRIARELLAKLTQEKLVLDWRKRQQTRAAVQVLIEETLFGQLPTPYSEAICQEKSVLVYEHVYDHYWGAGQSVYAMAG